MIECRGCRETKPLDAFHRNKMGRHGRCATCKACRVTKNRAIRLTPEGSRRERDKQYRTKFGITLDDYERMLSEQDGVCAICERPERAKRGDTLKHLAVDHCHATGVVRGLLCADCNTAIGKLLDDPSAMRRAAQYVEAHQ